MTANFPVPMNKPFDGAIRPHFIYAWSIVSRWLSREGERESVRNHLGKMEGKRTVPQSSESSLVRQCDSCVSFRFCIRRSTFDSSESAYDMGSMNTVCRRANEWMGNVRVYGTIQMYVTAYSTAHSICTDCAHTGDTNAMMDIGYIHTHSRLQVTMVIRINKNWRTGHHHVSISFFHNNPPLPPSPRRLSFKTLWKRAHTHSSTSLETHENCRPTHIEFFFHMPSTIFRTRTNFHFVRIGKKKKKKKSEPAISMKGDYWFFSFFAFFSLPYIVFYMYCLVAVASGHSTPHSYWLPCQF